MIAVTKYVRSLNITTKTTSGDVEGTAIADSAFRQFISRRTMRIDEEGGFTLIPFHAVDHVITSVTQTQETIDNDCDMPCSVMPDPTLTVPQTAIDAVEGEEFDPMSDVTAVDGNGHSIADDVTVEVVS